MSDGLDTEIAEQSLGTINSIVRKVIRAELKATENRLAKLAAKTVIEAATCEHMLNTLFVRVIQGDASEKQRQAKEIRDDARRRSLANLKQQIDDDEYGNM